MSVLELAAVSSASSHHFGASRQVLGAESVQRAADAHHQ